MKKIALMIMAALVMLPVLVYGQTVDEMRFMRFYLPDCLGSPFPVSVDAYFVMVENGKNLIKTHANFSCNAVEFKHYQKYAVPKGNSIYLKLDNGDIITLTCDLDEIKADGFVTAQNNVYQNYAGYSYFPVDTVIIEKLKTNNVVKVRGQFTREVLDGSMQFTPESTMPETKEDFIQAVQYVEKRYKDVIEEKNKQDKLKDNPLHDF